MVRVTFYTRQGCHLCERAHAVLIAAAGRAGFELDVQDVDDDEALYARYNEQVPVIAINGRDAFGPEIRLEEFLKRLKQES